MDKPFSKASKSGESAPQHGRPGSPTINMRANPQQCLGYPPEEPGRVVRGVI